MTDTTLRARVALEELEAMGLTVDDLLAVAGSERPARPTMPTVAEYVDVVRDGYKPRTQRTYNSYWKLLVELHGDLPLNRVTVDDLIAVANEAERRARTRRAGSDGRASRESCVAAMRGVFTRAHTAGLVTTNLARKVEKPRRLPNRRRAYSPSEIEDVWKAVAITTRDPDLHLFLVRFHLESGARRQGAINLRLGDIDPDRQTIWLREKFGAEREQPVSRSLIDATLQLARTRGAVNPDDRALRTARRRNGTCCGISDRTYDRLFERAQEHIPWAQRTPVCAHALRHTAIKAVDRLAGPTVAQGFAGHAATSVTGVYTRASLGEIAAAVAVLTGEPHPLAGS